MKENKLKEKDFLDAETMIGAEALAFIENANNLSKLIDRFESGDISNDIIGEISDIAETFCKYHRIPDHDLTDLLIRLIDANMERPLDFSGDL